MPIRLAQFLLIALAQIAAVFHFALADPGEPRPQVVIVAEQPTWNYRFLAAALGRDAEFKIEPLLVKDGAKASDRLRGCSVVILVDPSEKLFADDPALAKTVAKIVDTGGGLVFMTQQTWTKDHPLAALLPVAPRDGDQLEQRDAPALTRPRPTGEGLRSPILRLADDPMRNQQLWREELAPAFGPPVPVAASAEATVLAVDPHRRLGDQPVPLIVAGRRGKGRVVLLNNSQTWRWRAQPVGNPHGRFWSQVTRFAAGAEEE